MANPEHLAILKQGVEVWNRWRKENPRIIPDLSGRVSLRGANLACINLAKANIRLRSWAQVPDLSMVNLQKADPSSADLLGAVLAQADLSSANLRGANLGDTKLQTANLSGADLVATSFHNTTLTRANFSNCLFGFTILHAVNLGSVVELESIDHDGPSFVDTRTLLRSRPSPPTAFLRGCGLPEKLIEYLPSLLVGLQIVGWRL
jgi:hypothetical protein